MALTVTKSGPYFNGTSAPSNTTNMSFSQLRNTFRLNNPTGEISASELLRNIDTSNSDPIVPDCTENANSGPANSGIGTSTDWKVSQFQGSIKFFDIEQDAADTNSNFNISGITEFNNNLGKNIKKKLILRGTHTSTNTNDPAAETLFASFNLILEIYGVFYGAGGIGGTPNSPSGKKGGSAIKINGGSVTIDVKSTGKIWGGGGGGEVGKSGTAGSAGTCTKTTTSKSCGGTPSCPSGFTLISTTTGGCCKKERWCWGPWNSFCHNNCVASTKIGTCQKIESSSIPPSVDGGDGGDGRGFNNFSDSLSGSKGSQGGCPQCANNTFTLTGGKCSTDGNNGGQGGDWGQNGENTSASGSGGAGGAAVEGSGFSVTGNNSDTVKGSI